MAGGSVLPERRTGVLMYDDLRENLLLLPDCWIFDVQEHSIL